MLRALFSGPTPPRGRLGFENRVPGITVVGLIMIGQTGPITALIT